MKLGNPHDEIKFHAVNHGITYFLVILDGEPTMRIACNSADPNATIWVSTPDGSTSILTKGRFTTYTKLLEDTDGAPLGTELRVDRKSVYGYILPRLHVMLGRLLREVSTVNPCAGGKCPNPAAHAEGAHDL